MKPNKSIIGKQYGYRSSALRAIRNFLHRNKPSRLKEIAFWVNKIDDGCFEIEGHKC